MEGQEIDSATKVHGITTGEMVRHRDSVSWQEIEIFDQAAWGRNDFSNKIKFIKIRNLWNQKRLNRPIIELTAY